MAFEVRGDSMDNGTKESLEEGEILICREVTKDLWQYKLHLHKWNFVIVHQTEGIVVKRITEHDVEKRFLRFHEQVLHCKLYSTKKTLKKTPKKTLELKLTI